MGVLMVTAARSRLALIAVAIGVAFPAGAAAQTQAAPALLASAAVPLSLLKGGTVAAQGYSDKASLAPGARAAYERVVMFRSGNSFVFVDERLLEAESPAVAKTGFAATRREFTPASFGGWDATIHDLYIVSALLPVSSTSSAW